MGNYKFRLSDMMPNAWFYKLKDMGKSRNQNQTKKKKKKKQQPTFGSPTTTTPLSSKSKQPHQVYTRKSYYFSRELDPKSPDSHNFPDPPRKSSKQRLKRRNPTSPSPKLVTSSVSAGCNCKASLESWTKSDSPPQNSSVSSPAFSSPELRCDRVLATQTFDGMVSLSNSYGVEEDCEEDDIVIDIDKASLSRKTDFPDGFDSFPEIELPPIITKQSKFDDSVREIKKKWNKNDTGRSGRRSETTTEEKNREQRASPVRRFPLNSPGVKLRLNSPRISTTRKSFSGGRKSLSSARRERSLSDSAFAIVKSSSDPQKDFRESMVEMILQNNIRDSKDLEDLLACYLSLNSDEYHDLIIKVFKQIWFDLSRIKSK
ncbi:hypothetical protein UlMin_000823 [Ulmus minor]